MPRLLAASLFALSLFVCAARGADEEGFKSIFNGKDLTGWKVPAGQVLAVEEWLEAVLGGGGSQSQHRDRED